MVDIQFREIEKKWQKRWDENKIFCPEPDEREKFFITIPYPYLNGNLHAGHTRTLTIGDAVARYKRMLGFNVLFPMGFHVTGTPIIGLAELISNRDERTFKVYTDFHNVPEDILTTLNEPHKIVEYFSKEALGALKEIGFSIDWRRVFTTTDEGYKKFIEWQFWKLKEMNMVVKGSHPVRFCPHDQNPVEDHDILMGENATIVDFTVLKFLDEEEDIVFPCATLRPETVFGVTNLWLKPTEYQLAKVDGEKWLVSKEAYEKLKYTEKDVEPIRKVRAEDYFGKYVKNPATGDRIPILPAEFVDTENATGVVMSVPAHAPYDYIAIEDLKKKEDNGLSKYGIGDIKPIVLIKVGVKGFYDDSERENHSNSEFSSPAEEIVRKMGITNQKDESLEKATKTLYKKEFHEGVLLDITGKYAGIKVSEIKDKLQSDFIKQNKADIFYEFSETPVVCRCGTKCVVKVVKDQWFLNYSNPEWKGRVLDWLEKMAIIPDYYKEEFRNKIAWLKDKACARRKGLGTKIPWDNEWLIESLSDSTIYMSYYILAKYINEGKLKAENITPKLLDYVFLGEGAIEDVVSDSRLPETVIDRIKSDFEYWYPVDLRSSGKDLVANHLLFFLFHHVAIFPEEKYPRAIAVNGYVSLEGQKMSKSKGPLLTMKKAVNNYGADVTKIYILYASEYDSDADWRKKGVESVVSNLSRFYNLTTENSSDNEIKESEITMLDRWLVSRFQRAVKETRDAMDNVQTRRAINTAFFEVMSDVRWYIKRGGTRLSLIIDDWVKLMAPFAPYVCEEIWNLNKNHNSFISLERYPEFDSEKLDFEAERSEEYVISLLRDIKEVLKFVNAKEVYIGIADKWKSEVLETVYNSSNVKEAMAKLMSDGRFRKMGKEVTSIVKKIFKERKDGEKGKILQINEENVIRNSITFLEGELGVKIILDSSSIPKDKLRTSMPGKPAIYAV